MLIKYEETFGNSDTVELADFVGVQIDSCNIVTDDELELLKLKLDNQSQILGRLLTHLVENNMMKLSDVSDLLGFYGELDYADETR